MDIAGTGIWSGELRYGDPGEVADAAAELEELGYSALWVPDVGGDVFGAVAALLQATTSAVVATGILNLWMHDAGEVAARHGELAGASGRRFLLGIGVSHAPLVEGQTEQRYERPLAVMRDYLDRIDAAATPVATDERVLAALGPKMLSLARDRASGAHPYLATPEHTNQAREVLGSGATLAPEQTVVFDTDPSSAREVARGFLAGYLTLPNYANNLLRLGFSEDDVRDGGSDRLVDEVVAWGDEAAIEGRVAQHRAAGADHVCIQVATGAQGSLPRDAWRRLAPALT